MGKERAVAVAVASASFNVSAAFSPGMLFISLSLSLSLSAPPLFTPSLFSVTVYLLLLQLFGFTIQHAAGCTTKGLSLNSQTGKKARRPRIGDTKSVKKKKGRKVIEAKGKKKKQKIKKMLRAVSLNLIFESDPVSSSVCLYYSSFSKIYHQHANNCSNTLIFSMYLPNNPPHCISKRPT